jgi:hypothetical protein
MGSFHGISSLVLLALATLAGLIGVALDTPAAAVAGTLLMGGALLVICGAYCAKCPCRTNHCGHLIPGLIAQRLPARRQGPYTRIDLALTAIAVAAMIFYSQPWLWGRWPLMVLFWLLVLVAVAQILLRVCRSCRNTGCPVQRLRPAGIRSWKADTPAD